MERSTRRWASVLLVSIMLAPATTSTITAEEPPTVPDCESPGWVESLGPACVEDDGYKLWMDDGTSFRTHGPDPPPGDRNGSSDFNELPANSRPVPPVCAPEGDYRNRLIYAAPEDVGIEESTTFHDRIRELVHQANGFVRQQSEAYGYEIDLEFACNEEGEIAIDVHVLDHTNAEATFRKVVQDLRDLGYDDEKEKYWIWYDDAAKIVDAGGTATRHVDDSDAADNRNNRGPSYGVTWGYMSASIMLHEAGHTLGAVQESAPHYYSHRGGHCYDGLDVMCYGPEHDSSVCPLADRFDCGKDDYFHPDPPAGSYLANHWNLGSELNRFIEKEPCSLYHGANEDLFACGSQVDVRPSGDAEAQRVALSGHGDSSGAVAASPQGEAWGTIAIAGTDDAHSGILAASGTSNTYGSVALSGTGDSQAASRWYWIGPAGLQINSVAASGSGDAASETAALSLGGSSESRLFAASGTEEAAGFIAVSGTDDASSCEAGSLVPLPLIPGCTAVSLTGDAEGGLAISLTGQAEGERAVSGCETVRNDTDIGAACFDLDPED